MGEPGRKPEVSDAEILSAIHSHPDAVVTASDIADIVDLTGAGVNNRLPNLVDAGLVIRKDVGARAAVYWLSDQGRDELRDA